MLDKAIKIGKLAEVNYIVLVRKITKKYVYFFIGNVRFKMKIPKTNHWSKPIKGHWEDVKAKDTLLVSVQSFVMDKDMKFFYIDKNITQNIQYKEYHTPFNISQINVDGMTLAIVDENGTDILLESEKGHTVWIRKPNNDSWIDIKLGDVVLCDMKQIEDYYKLYVTKVN